MLLQAVAWKICNFLGGIFFFYVQFLQLLHALEMQLQLSGWKGAVVANPGFTSLFANMFSIQVEPCHNEHDEHDHDEQDHDDGDKVGGDDDDHDY